MQVTRINIAWLLSLLLVPAVATADLPCPHPDQDGLDHDYYSAIADDPERLHQLLADDFVYRTTAGTDIGKQALISYLLAGKTRIKSPAIVSIRHLCRPDTLLSAGAVELLVEEGDGPRPVRADFTHVWVREDGVWRLLYRRSEASREREAGSHP